MRKLIFELFLFVAILGSIWFLLSRIDWMTILKVEQATKSTEEKIGDMFWGLLEKSETEITSASLVSPVDSLLIQISTKNKIDRTQIKLHFVRKDEINAFALPNNHLVVYSGLVNACENESELCGVIGHELAHIEKNHIMNKLIKDFGLSVLISMSAGKGNSEMIKEAIKHLSSTAFDRTLESEADMTSVDYLIKANIDPEPFANFLYRLSLKNENLPSQIYWISTHPDSKERAEKIAERIKSKTIVKSQILRDSTWILLKKKLKENE